MQMWSTKKNSHSVTLLGYLWVCVLDEVSKYFPDRSEVLRSPVISPWNMCVCVTGSLLIVHFMAAGCLKKHDMWLQHSWGSCSCLTGNVDRKIFPYRWVNLLKGDGGVWKWVLVVKHSQSMIYCSFSFLRLLYSVFFSLQRSLDTAGSSHVNVAECSISFLSVQCGSQTLDTICGAQRRQ